MRIILTCTVFFICICFSSKANTDKFFSSVNRLSNSHINKIYQDKEGLIWICTENGLNVFDGSTFRTFYHVPNDTTSLMNNSVLSILEDSAGNLWVGTSGGLQRFEKETERFINIHFSYPYVTDFSYINCIIEDHAGNIWVTTNRSGAICLKAKTHQPTYYMKTTSNICSNKINVIYEDRFNNIWFGSQDNGVSILNTQNQIITNYSHDPSDINSLSSNWIFSIIENPEGNILVGTIDKGIDLYEYSSHSFKHNYIPFVDNIYTMCNDSKGSLWIGTDGWGLKCYDYETRITSTYESPVKDFDLTKSKVHSILEDLQGNLWIAVYQKGILMISPNNRQFKSIGFNPFNSRKNIGTDCVLSIYKDRTENIWIGTDGEGIFRLNNEYDVIQHYQGDRMPGKSVLAIFGDSKNRIWAGSYLHGLFLYDADKNKFQRQVLEVNGVDVKHINIITEDNEGNLWIGTNDNGLCIYNPESRSVEVFQYDLLKSADQILGNTIHTILFGKNEKVWIGTSINGLSCFNRKNNTFTDYTQQNGMLNSNNIYSVAEDKDGNIWVGTKAGLNFINVLTGKTTFYTEADGLSNTSVYGLEIDKEGNLWMSTGRGLSNFNVQTGHFTNYYTNDGLINDEFRRGAHFQSSSGEIFFGGINGVSYFYPFHPQSSYSLLNLLFTNLLIYNEEVKINQDQILKKSLNYSDEIVLNYSVNSFTIGFIGVEYSNPDKVVYQIKMEGFDNEWKTLPGSNHYATYTNLPPGKYKFTVRANIPGTDYKERSLSILITPPVWQTWWAKLIYAVLILIFLYFIYRVVMLRVKEKQKELKRANENQIMQSKLQFFTDISHEIRTPLTLILTPVEHLLSTTTDLKLKETYHLISQNGQRILRLINQIMEMRKLDKGQVRLQAEKTDVVKLARGIMTSFDYLAVEKEINFRLEVEPELPEVWIDQEKLDKVIFNMLSNAFKYTPSGGTIEIQLETTDTSLLISISDTGIGIPNELKESIFNRFYQIPNESNKNKMGTGIGLHLSRSLMEIHHGEIFVADSETGSRFVITLPLNDSYLQSEERLSEPSEKNVTTIVQPSVISATTQYSDTTIKNNSRELKHKYKLLIVEDDSDIRNYIKQILSDEYNILEAQNGKIGLELTMKENPDCVITDLSMEGMDGLELCKKIKVNENTCHIPVIILTARTALEQRVEGLQVGADSYIPKPFNIDHLRVRISKLIELRALMKNKFQGKFEIKEDEIKIKSTDEKFLEKLEETVKKQLANPDLSVETISKEIGVSRSQLQRKLKQLTKQNPSEYIKTTRLRHAAYLLTSKKLSISEIAYATGFSSLSHFSNSFKEYYGLSPSQYMEINNTAEKS
ncbi:MAG: response regulator [Candidatus Azobacteroides sp.]|nr:response regulator [Candidatus Azobacteroides sp.]